MKRALEYAAVFCSNVEIHLSSEMSSKNWVLKTALATLNSASL
jgi:hypothetical protein